MSDFKEMEKIETVEDVEIIEANAASQTKDLIIAEQTAVDASGKDLYDENSLSEEERAQVETYMSQIDITDSQVVFQYGSGAQKNVSEFTETALANVRTVDLGEVGGMITGVVTELKGFSTDDEKGGLFGMFKKSKNKLAGLQARYNKAEANIETIKKTLEAHSIRLMKDSAILDKMYEENLADFRQLTLYIIAGKKKIEEARSVELPKLLEKAKQSGLQEDAQAAKDYALLIDRFEKKVYDLELSRNISLQMAPQIRLIQSNDTVMAEKIQSTIVNTIPLWKSQMIIALGLHHSQEAAQAQATVSDMTNELLLKNAEALKMASIASAKESERGIVDIETLKSINQSLIDTLDEIVEIHRDGRAKRKEAEGDLVQIEEQLKSKLIEMSEESIKVD